MRRSERVAVGQYTAGFGISLAAAVLINAALVIVKDTHSGVRDWMVRTASHHWIAHTIAVVGIFILLGIVRARAGAASRFSARTLWISVAASVVVGSLAIMIFYILHASGAY